MFAANVTGTVQRIIHDNGKSGKDAMLKVVLAVSKRYAKDPKESKIFPLFTIWGFDADYMRKYVGVGQPVAFMDCELEVYKNENKLDEDGNAIEQYSYRVGKGSFFKADILKALVEAGVAEEGEGGDGDDDDDDDRSSRRKKKSSSSRGSSRSERRGGSSSSKSRGRARDEEDDDDEDEEEEERPRRKSSSSRGSSSSRKSSSSRGKTSSRGRSRDEDDDDDDDDDDNYFDED